MISTTGRHPAIKIDEVCFEESHMLARALDGAPTQGTPSFGVIVECAVGQRLCRTSSLYRALGIICATVPHFAMMINEMGRKNDICPSWAS